MGMIEISNFNFSYGSNQVLKNISLSIEKNKFYAIIGPNGSGKTTLIKNISHSSGINNIHVCGKPISKYKLKELAKIISVVPQETNITFNFTSLDIVLMGRSPYIKRFQSESSKDIDIAKDAMLKTSTWHLKDREISKISGGERQRVIISRAIAQDTPIMLLDEPISSLDMYHQIEIMQTLSKLKESKGATIITVMHDLNLAARFCDCIVLMHKGKIVDAGIPQKILTKAHIKNIYGVDSEIISSPIDGKPMVIPY